jgi:hypothetical protein
MTKDYIARTGRVRSWMDNPESKLPVSCTVFVVDDSMTGENGIEKSWRYVSFALRHAAGVAVHLSNLRPRGTENGKGLVASGPVSFARIYSCLNEVLRRGGTYRNGACVCVLDLCHQDVEEFVDATRAELPWIKKCIQVTPEWWAATGVNLREKILRSLKAGDLWLTKVKYDQKGDRVFSNVCQEIFLKSRGSCLLTHVNLGACEIDELYDAFYEGMVELCKLHPNTGVGDTGEYLDPSEDKQVGLGMLGLANFLSIHGVSYAAFGEALALVDDTTASWSPALCIARDLRSAINNAANVARAYGMDRAFTIAPTATCSYKYHDLRGNTTTPEIAPPISNSVDRDSGTFGVQSYFYGDVEIASEVGWDNYKAVANGICQLLENTGLFHGYSYNHWSDCVTYNEEFIQDWFNSPQTSLYYALQVSPDTLRKDDVSSIMDEDYANIFDFQNNNDDDFCSSCAE